jgi:hypothetical protein
MKKIISLLILFSIISFAQNSHAMGCLDKKTRIMPDKYVLTAAKCIGILEQYGTITGEDNSFFGTKKWHDIATMIDKSCKYGDGKISTKNQATFAKANFTGYFTSKNLTQVKALLSGCNMLLDKALE